MDNGREYNWNDSIEKDSEFEAVPEGDYDFEVIGFERARHNGSDNLPPCPKAVIMMKITSPEASTTIKHNLFLHSKTEGLLCAFFTGIGQRKHGERITMDWNRVVGSRGRCKVNVNKQVGRDGVERTYNNIVKFYEPAEPAQQFKPGQF